MGDSGPDSLNDFLPYFRCETQIPSELNAMTRSPFKTEILNLQHVEQHRKNRAFMFVLQHLVILCQF